MQEFDMNDPTLELEMPDDYNPEAELGGGIPQPPADGPHKLAFWLAEDTEQKMAVRQSKGKIVATFKVRVVKDNGDFGQYLNEYYPTTQVFDGQRTSALTNMCRLAGKVNYANPNSQPDEYIKNVRATFSTDVPTIFTAQTQWVKSVPDLNPETGEHKVDSISGYKMYTKTKGMVKIKAAAVAAVQQQAATEGWDSDSLEKGLEYATRNPHLYTDPLTGDEKSVRAEVRYVIGK